MGAGELNGHLWGQRKRAMIDKAVAELGCNNTLFFRLYWCHEIFPLLYFIVVVAHEYRVFNLLSSQLLGTNTLLLLYAFLTAD